MDPLNPMLLIDNWDRYILNNVYYVYYRVSSRWTLWTSIEPSTLIPSGDQPVDYGFGLFARRQFNEDDVIGVLTGDQVGEDVQTDWLVRLENGIIIDTERGRTGYVQYINDAIDTTAENNCAMDPTGVIIATTRIEPGHEILMSYGKNYWESE